MPSGVSIETDGSPHAPRHGHQVVGRNAKKLTLLGDGKLTRGVIIRAPGPNDTGGKAGGNTGTIFVGGPLVTADYNEGTGGMPIAPGESLTIPCLDPSTLYVVGTVLTDDDDAAWMGI